jgi:1,4-alpha-glucan branching enzyme
MKRDIAAGMAVPADWLTNFDRYLISEGTHERAYEKLGAHLMRFGRKEGVVFAVWAPNARQVSVVAVS